MNEKNIPVTDTSVAKKATINCPRCGSTLSVKTGNYAHICPVCSQMFRTRSSERLVKDVSNKTMVEAFVFMDQDKEGVVKADSLVSEMDE